MRRRVVPGICAFALAMAILPSSASPVVSPTAQDSAFLGQPASATGDADVRALRLRGPSLSAARAANAFLTRAPHARIKWNARLGTVKHVWSDSGYLTGPASGIVSAAAAQRIARSFLRSQRALFGLSFAEVASLSTTRNTAMPQGGPHVLVFRVRYGDIPTFSGGQIGVNLTRDGRIGSVWADTAPSSSATVAALARSPKISATDALAAVARREGVRGFKVQPIGQRRSGDRLALFGAGGAYLNHNARLVAFPTASGPRLAWRVFFAKGAEEMLSTAVDATSGVVLFRHNQVAHASGDAGRVFRNHPGAPKGGTHELVSFEGDKTASPQGWVGQAPTTIGNNVLSFTDWTWPKAAPAGLAPAAAMLNPVPDYMPVSPTRTFDYAFTNEWGKDCDPAVSTVAGDVVESPAYARDRDASVTNLFYFGNVIHDFAYRYGFTEAMGNMQQENFSGKGRGQDAIRFMAQAGIATGNLDNAFMFTPADGGEPQQFADPANPTFAVNYIPPFSGMFMWRPVRSFQAPCVDGSQDASTAYHEYTHGISGRFTGGPDDADGLAAHQSGSMGEGWSDWVAHVILDSQNIEDRTADGIYITGNTVTGIRHFRLDANPLTFGDIGFGVGGPEVHDDGEIWSATLWDLRNAFVKKYGKKAGLDRVTRLVFDGMAAQPRLPDMLDARDAIIAADRMRYRGANAALLWSVFARRGMGVSARSRDASDLNPRPAFDARSGNGVFSGSITDASGAPIVAKVLIGFGEGKPTPVATSSRSGAFKIPMTSGTYPVTIAAAGYGLQKVGSVVVKANQATFRKFSMQRNLASAGWGAAITSGLPAGDPGLALIDDHEFTGQILTFDKPVVIRLAGNAPASVSSVSLSPKPSNGGTLDNVTAYDVELSADGRTWKSVLSGGVKKYKPRPIALNWSRVTKLTRGMKARFARVTIAGTLGGQAEGILAGLQVLGTAPGMKVSRRAADARFVDSDGAIASANPGAPDAGVTASEFLIGCSAPVSQGLDSYVVEMPVSAGDGTHFFATSGGSEAGRDLDVFFYDATCSGTGSIATSSADEAGVIPAGSRWVVVVLYAGTTDGFTVTVTPTLESVIPPAGVQSGSPPPTSGGGGPQEIPYVGVAGDFFILNCNHGVTSEAPEVGGVCVSVEPGDRVTMKVADDSGEKVGGFYYLIPAEPADPADALIEGPPPVQFCEGFTTDIPADIVEVDVYLDQAFSPLSGCDSGPATTGVVQVTIR